MSVSFFTGKGAKVYIAALPDGVDLEPVACEPTLDDPAIKGAVTITLTTALPAGVLIPNSSYLDFVDDNGYEVLVQLNADAKAGDATLTVKALPEAIALNAKAKYPLELRARTSSDLGRQGKRVTTVTFDSDGYERGLTTTLAIDLKMKGNWTPLDAAYATAEQWFNEGKQQLFFWLHLPNPRTTVFSGGKVYKGPGSISAMPLSIPADGIITGDIDAAFNGKPEIVDPIPKA